MAANRELAGLLLCVLTAFAGGCNRPCYFPEDDAAIDRLRSIRGELQALCRDVRDAGHREVLSNRPGSALGRRVADLGLRRIDVGIPGYCIAVAWDCGAVRTSAEKGFALVEREAILPSPLLPDLENRTGDTTISPLGYRKVEEGLYLYRTYVGGS